MHWIRFLKLPKPTVVKGRRCAVNALITITTDLGESFLMNDCALYVWVEYPENERLSPSSKTDYRWSTGIRQLAVQCSVHHPDASMIRISVTSAEDLATEYRLTEQNTSLSRVVAARAVLPMESGPFLESYTERQLSLPGGSVLSIYEETGESIARHVWDAGIGFVDCLINRVTALPELSAMFSNSTKRGLEVIELGCGCGLVGLALTVWKENCRVILTDLPEAESIANFNLSKNRGAKSSTAEFKVLRWGEPIPDYLKRIPRDLVLVTDCTYNPSSAPALVATLKTLANESPHLLIVVAMKIRHPSEAVFFDLMEAASLIQIDHCVNPLPNAEENEYSKGEGIEIYCFRLG